MVEAKNDYSGDYDPEGTKRRRQRRKRKNIIREEKKEIKGG